MFPLKYVKIRSYEAGLYFRDGEFQRLLPPGRHWLFHPLDKIRVDIVSQRAPWLRARKARRYCQEVCADRSCPGPRLEGLRACARVDRSKPEVPPDTCASRRSTSPARRS
jgi:hypothetical protein